MNLKSSHVSNGLPMHLSNMTLPHVSYDIAWHRMLAVHTKSFKICSSVSSGVARSQMKNKQAGLEISPKEATPTPLKEKKKNRQTWLMHERFDIFLFKSKEVEHTMRNE